jgi:hypothetical protein
MSLLTVYEATLAGVAVPYAAVTASDTVPVGDRDTAIHVKNAGAGSTTVTVAVPGNTAYGLAEPDLTVSVPAGSDRLIGPFDLGLADSSTGLVTVTCSPTTSVTIAAIKIG